jgi:hypothetical protein
MWSKMDEHEREQAASVRTLYADGGLALANPSIIGGAFAWCGVGTLDARPRIKGSLPGGLDHDSPRLIAGSNYMVKPAKMDCVTNNQVELWAVIRALESMPPNWSGRVCTDSQCTIGRVFHNQACRNVPEGMIARLRLVQAHVNLKKCEYVLLAGHPAKDDLEAGFHKKKGLPVSVHQDYCDRQCDREIERMITDESARRVMLNSAVATVRRSHNAEYRERYYR